MCERTRVAARGPAAQWWHRSQHQTRAWNQTDSETECPSAVWSATPRSETQEALVGADL